MKQMLMRKPVGKMAGLTLLETMFAIAVGALILIAAVIFYTTSKQSQNVSKVVTDMNTIVAQTSNYIAPGGASITNIMKGGDSVKTLQGANYLPDTMNDPWGQAYTAIVVKSTATGDGVVATTTITIFGADTNSCNAIVQAASTGKMISTAAGSCQIQFNL